MALSTGVAALLERGGQGMTDDEHVAYRVGLLERECAIVQAKVDRLVWALIGLALSIAGSAVVFALTVAGLGK